MGRRNVVVIVVVAVVVVVARSHGGGQETVQEQGLKHDGRASSIIDGEECATFRIIVN